MGKGVPGARPQIAALQPTWTNETAYMGSMGGDYLGAVAYDPLVGSGALVYYGGCTPTQCPASGTWLYEGQGWVNETALFPTSPGPLESQSMDYDPTMGGVISAGGFNALGNMVGTWLFNSTGWYNITATAGAVPSYDGAMAWDPSLHALVYVDGCTFPTSCSSRWTGTWELTTIWNSVALGPGGINWAVAGESLAYDAADHALLFFGGYNGANDINYTFELSGTTWTNLTLTSAGCDSLTSICGYYPLGRAYAQITWAGQIGAIVMYGGYNSSSGSVYGDSWQFEAGKWLPSYLYYTGSLPDQAIAEGEMAVNSTDIAPILIGGINGAFGESISSYAFEAAPQLTVSIVRNPTEVGSLISINVSVQVGTGSGPWVGVQVDVNGTAILSSDRYGINFTTVWAFGPAAFSEAQPGTYPVVAYVDDWSYGMGYGYGNITVVPTLVVHASANVTTSEVRLPFSFSGSATGGSGTYSSYAWNFGDSNTGSGAAVQHTFIAAGTYHVRLNVTDSDGIANSSTVTVVVLPLLVASAVTSTPTNPATGATVTFGVTVAGGDTPYAAYAWTFGDGATGTGATPTHSFSKAGTFTVSVTVTDSLGVKSSAQLSVTVSSPPNSTAGFSLTSGTGLYLLIGVILVIVVIGAVLMLRRKKPGIPAPPPPGAAGGIPAGASGAPPPPP